MNVKYNQLGIKIILPLFLMAIILSSNNASALLTPMSASVGDKFYYKITKSSNSEKYNGVETAQAPLYKAGDKVKVVVNHIDTDNTGSMYVNVTETINKQDQNTSSYVDGWYFTFLGTGFIAGITSLGYPNNVNFTIPTPSTSTTENTASLFPYFATSNSSFYDSMVTSLESSYKSEPGVTLNVANNAANHTFNFSFTYSVSVSNTTTKNEAATYSLIYKFAVSIDVSKSIVTNFYTLIDSHTTVGSQSKTFYIEAGMKQDSGIIAAITNWVPQPSVWFCLFSLFAITVIINKKRVLKY